MSDALPQTITTVDGVDALPAVVVAADPLKDPYLAYLATLDAAESKRTMRGCLDRIARILTGHDPNGVDPETGEIDPAALAITGQGFPWHLLRYEHAIQVRAIIAKQATRQEDGTLKPWSPAHRNKHLVALRQVLDQAWRLGLISAEDRDRAQRLDPFKGKRLPAGEHVPIERVGALLAECDADAVLPESDSEDPREQARREDRRRRALRDAAVIAVLYGSGVRRAELAGLALADYDPAARSLKVRGKGDKERLVYINSSTVGRVEAWLTIRGRDPGGLFPPFTPRGGHIRRDKQGRIAHMKDGQSVSDILAARSEQAGIQPQAAHDMRRTFIGELLDAGVDLATAQALAGHASPSTTARYDRRPEKTRRDAVDRLRTPEATPLPGAVRRRDHRKSSES
ncbi:tyrosine-type recombinase/integrase [Nonomuraea recticatena]|uniref:Tyrosine-type recombinase/integrase n=1 Tax=Nonomuraea recticatena TaxID=46178 RepID=A0ABN3TFH0_9ACTN